MQPVEPVTPLTPRRSSRRDYRTPDEARRVLADAAGSGLTLAAFTRQHVAKSVAPWTCRQRVEPSRRRMAFSRATKQYVPDANGDKAAAACITIGRESQGAGSDEFLRSTKDH